MPILAVAPAAPAPSPPAESPVALDQSTVTRVATEMRLYCAPTTWDRFVRSLAANRFPYQVAPPATSGVDS